MSIDLLQPYYAAQVLDEFLHSPECRAMPDPIDWVAVRQQLAPEVLRRMKAHRERQAAIQDAYNAYTSARTMTERRKLKRRLERLQGEHEAAQ